MMVASLRKLPLTALLSPSDGAAGKGGAEGPDGSTPAYLSRDTLQLCFATRKQIYKLKDLELALLRAFSGQDVLPSILKGALVRFVSKQEYRMALISETREEPAGQLMLRPQGFDRWVPSSCLSNTCTLSDDKQWAALGRDEVCALLRTLAGAMPSRREIAATCCRLSTGWLWACQGAGAFRAALAADPAAVVAQLEDPAAVAALLPCVEEPATHSSRPPTPAEAAAAAARAAAAFRQKAQHGGSGDPEQPAQQHGRPASPPWSAGTQPAVASQQQQAQVRDGPAPKRQRADSPSAGSTGQQQQQQQQQHQSGGQPPLQHLLQPAAEAFRFGFAPQDMSQRTGQVFPPASQMQQPTVQPPPPTNRPLGPSGQLLPASFQLPPPLPLLPPFTQPVQTPVSPSVAQHQWAVQQQQQSQPPPQQQQPQPQPQQQQSQQQSSQQQQQPLLAGRVQAPLWPVLKQSPTAGYAWMPAGGALERGLMQAVHALTSSAPTEPRQLGDLGNQLLAMKINYKNYCGNHRTLTQCVHELYYRGLIVLYSQTVRQAKSYYFAAQPARLLP